MSQEWTPNYSVCTETGLRICEILPHVWVRTDGYIRNCHPKSRAIALGWKQGSLTNRGYRIVNVCRKMYAVHRLVCQAFDPQFDPLLQIDHIDGDTSNNCIANLRSVTCRENHQNLQIHRKGKLVGALFCNRTQLWRAEIKINKRKTHLGMYRTEYEAHLRYMEVAASLK